MIKDNRIGKFSIPNNQLSLDLWSTRAIMEKVVIVRAEYLWQGLVEYAAICADFRPVPPHETTPEYMIVIDEVKEEVTFHEVLPHER